jgi:hypothetical protein
MAPEISRENERPAQYVFSSHVQKMLAEVRASNPRARKVQRQPVEPAE